MHSWYSFFGSSLSPLCDYYTTRLSEWLGFAGIFLSKRKWFFGVFLATLFVNLLDGLIKDQTSTPMYFPFLLTLGALLTKNMKYHAAVALIFSVGLTVSSASRWVGSVGGELKVMWPSIPHPTHNPWFSLFVFREAEVYRRGCGLER